VTTFAYAWSGGRVVTTERGASEHDPEAASFGARDEHRQSAVGWPFEESRFDGTGKRIDLVRRNFDCLGQEIALTRFKDPAAATGPVLWQRRVDGSGAPLRVSEPGLSAVVNRYDEWGGMVESTWNDGGIEQVVRTRYDGLGRTVLEQILERNAQAPSAESLQWEQRYAYDEHSGSQYQPTGALVGRLSRITVAGIGDSYFAYDGLGRTTSETQVLTGHDEPMRTSWLFASGGRLREMDFQTPIGTDRIEYGHDSAGRVVRVWNPSNDTTYFHADSVDAKGRYHQFRLGNGVVEKFEYALGGDEKLKRWDVQTASGPRVLELQSYDAQSRILSERTQWSGTSYQANYKYDALDRLTQSEVATNGTTTGFTRETFAYDSLGNLASRTNTSSSNHSRAYGYGALDPDRLCRYDLQGQSGTGCPFVYDKAGNLLMDNWSGTRSFAYDAASRVTDVVKGGWHATVTYGPAGARSRTDVWSGTTLEHRTWRFGLIEQRTRPDGGTQIERRIPGPLGLIATLRDDGALQETVYVHGDGRANRFFTTSDGAVAQAVQYRSYGSVLSDSGVASTISYTDDLWNGGDELRQLGVVILGARVYDPHIGRFLQRDPIIATARSTTANPYAFSFNDPVNFADPTGLLGDCIGKECQGTIDWTLPWDPSVGGTASGGGGGNRTFSTPTPDTGVGSGLASQVAMNRAALQDVLESWRCTTDNCTPRSFGEFVEEVKDGFIDGAHDFYDEITGANAHPCEFTLTTTGVCTDYAIEKSLAGLRPYMDPVGWICEDLGGGSCVRGAARSAAPMALEWLLNRASAKLSSPRATGSDGRRYHTGKPGRLPTHLRNKLKRIRNATAAGGNRGIDGVATIEDAVILGREFVGPGYRLMSNGRGLVSADGLRTFRAPSSKRGVNPRTGEAWSRTGVQVNFETKPSPDAPPTSNVHLDVEE
jgi:RHS repeat-associated protein